MEKLQQAPGELEHVRAFVNTRDLEGQTDELAGPEALGRWLSRRGLLDAGVTVGRADLRRSLELREALRAVLTANNTGSAPPAAAVRTLDATAERARVRLRFVDGARSQLLPAAGGVDGALGRLLAVVHAARLDGTWERLKACRDHTCAWAFYDHTKNRSGAWCDMAVCGNRAKARAYRERRAPSARR